MADSAPPPRFRIMGADDVEEFDFTSLSWEKEGSKTGSVESMGLFDPARAAKQIRFINKNESASVLVVAYPQKDSASRCNRNIKQHLEVYGVVKAGLEHEWQHVEGAPVPEEPIRCVLEGGGRERRENGEVRVDVPAGSDCVSFKWYAEVGANWKFAGQSYAKSKRNVVFTGLGEAAP